MVAIHSYIKPHNYTLRRAIKAWFLRLIHKETLYKLSFYIDELNGSEAGKLVKQIVEDMGGTDQPRGRSITIRGIMSWSDIGNDYRPGIGPRSRVIITVQGKQDFVSQISKRLREEKQQRKISVKRTSIINHIGGKWWAR